jgi:predicted porin
MNKKLVTLAVAAALVAPAAAMADATIYGRLDQSIDYINQSDASTIVYDPMTGDAVGYIRFDGYNGWTVSRADGNILKQGQFRAVDLDGNVVQFPDVQLPILNNGPVGPSNRIGVKGSEDLGNGLKAIYQVELGVRLADGNFSAADGDRGSIVMRNTFVGLAGGWGTFLVGRHDTPLKISTGKLDLFADTMADYNGPLGFNDVRADNAIAYISPSFSGFQLAGAVHAGGGATVEGDFNTNANSIAEAYSVAAIYSNGPFYASAAYESLGNDMTIASIYDPVCIDGYCTDLTDDFTKWRIGLGILDWNGFTLTGIYEDRSNVGFLNSLDSTSWEVQAGYSFGNNMIKAAYGALDRDSGNDRNLIDDITDFSFDNDLNQWSIAFDHNFSKRTKVYALYNNVDDDLLPNWEGFSLGIVHNF